MKMRTTAVFKLRRLAGLSGPLSSSTTIAQIADFIEKKLEQKWRLFRRDSMEKEIFNSCIVLKNLAVVHRNLPMSADFMLEQMKDSSRALKSVYADILTVYRSGRTEEAFALLPARVPAKSAKNFSMILAKIDQINPAELISQMTAFEEAFAADRVTGNMKRAERKSLVTTMAATASVFAVLLNFTVVVVFMDTMQLLRQAF